MIITVGGMPGSGKSTLARNLAEKLGYRHYSIGDLMRQLAHERNVSLLEISKHAEDDTGIDKALDDKQVQLAKKGDKFVIDSRLGWHFIPSSFKVFLTVSPEEGARRIYEDRRAHEHENISFAQTLENVQRRRESELKRYTDYYGLDPDREENYDIIIDTTHKSSEETLKLVLKAVPR